MTTDSDSERTRVQTYVPAYQKSIWEDHADDLGMTQSEFVRTMVQAGRRGFLSADRSEHEAAGEASSDPNPQGEGIEERVVALLTDSGPLDWDQLVERLVDDVEERLDDALTTLQEENRLRYSGREGGYVVTNE
ncbi:DUF5805 domain-containing protein [Salinigranum salinum]|uniref:DUF5805 domain-containing protein n=1 Tax=Salinigranum salinum TaxID=1364937 RepID=UPI0012613191|nr:DUF5805 domain-containing protein [Salinigranum salinum]